MMPFLVAGEDSPAGLLIATLGGDMEEVTPLGRSWLRRAASRATAVVTAPAAIVSKVSPSAGRLLNPVAQVRNAARTSSRITRATARPLMQLSRGNVRGAFIDLGRAATTTISAPITTAVSSVNAKAGQSLERVIARNDPNALINRKIFEAVKAAVRPIVRKFSGDDWDGMDSFGEENPQAAAAAAQASQMIASGASKKQMLRAARGKIIAAAGTAGAAAGTSVAGPYGAPIGVTLVPAAVDAVIEELTSKKPGAAEPVPDILQELEATGRNASRILIFGGVAAAAGLVYILSKKKKGK